MMLAAGMFPGLLLGSDETPPIAPRAGRRGRPRVSDDPELRQTHIRVAIHRLKLGNSLKQVCNRFDISPRTVQLWINRVRTYPEAAVLFPAP